MSNTEAIVVIGHSHLGPIRSGLANMEAIAHQGPRAQFFVHDVWQKNTHYADSAPEGGVVFNPEMLRLFDEVVPTGMPRRYVGVLGGNGHIVLALTKHPRAFDFVLPERPDLPLDSSAELLPYEYFCESLKHWMMPYVWQMIAFRQAIGQSFLCLETPPPYGDDNYVATHLGSYVPDPHNVVSNVMRYKIWRAHSDILKFFCTHNDIEFLPVPPEAIDADGFLKREGYGPEATHANAWYGSCVVRQIEQRFGLAFQGSQVFF